MSWVALCFQGSKPYVVVFQWQDLCIYIIYVWGWITIQLKCSGVILSPCEALYNHAKQHHAFALLSILNYAQMCILCVCLQGIALWVWSNYTYYYDCTDDITSNWLHGHVWWIRVRLVWMSIGYEYKTCDLKTSYFLSGRKNFHAFQTGNSKAHSISGVIFVSIALHTNRETGLWSYAWGNYTLYVSAWQLTGSFWCIQLHKVKPHHHQTLQHMIPTIGTT